MTTTTTRAKLDIRGWSEIDNQTNALATATRVAETGKRHQVTGVSGSFSAAAAGILLVVKDGTTEIYREYIHNAGGMSFPAPLDITEGAACSAELSAGGAAVIGSVNLNGYTI